MQTIHDYCVYYQKSCDLLTDAEIYHCADCGLTCEECCQCLKEAVILD